MKTLDEVVGITLLWSICRKVSKLRSVLCAGKEQERWGKGCELLSSRRNTDVAIMIS